VCIVLAGVDVETRKGDHQDEEPWGQPTELGEGRIVERRVRGWRGEGGGEVNDKCVWVCTKKQSTVLY
jgi:hypothetical protein